MLKNFWYGVEFASAITNQPRKVTVLGQDLVVYRTADGTPVAMSNVCMHRGGSLADGWLVGDCVACPYHGWEFDTEGRCRKIPANRAGQPIPKKAQLDHYPVAEKYGIIWVFLGDLPEAERPPLPVFPEYGAAGWKAIYGEFSWQANYGRVVENGLDYAHGPFVHSGSFGYREEPEIPDYDIEDGYGTFGARTTVNLPATPPKGLWKFLRTSKSGPGKVRVDLAFQMPNVNRIHLYLANDWQIIIFDVNIPVDEHTTRSLYVSLRNFLPGDWADRNAHKRVLQVFNEDKGTVEAQKPELVPYELSAELSVTSDQLPLRFRKMRRSFIDKGWGIDSDVVSRDIRGKRAVVIPSPARRANPEMAKMWVFDEVPTIGPGGRAHSPRPVDAAADAAAEAGPAPAPGVKTEVVPDAAEA